jgi:AraC-like DNA-binding protein
MLFDDLSIQLLSDQVCVSSDYLKHRFFFPTGETIWQLVKRMRLEHAFGLLKHSQYSVSEIGEMVGYQTKNSFSKAFRLHFNQSPSQSRVRFDLIPRNCTGSFANDALNPVDFRNISIKKLPGLHYFFKYYDPLTILKGSFESFKASQDPKGFLSAYKSEEVQVVLKQSDGLASVIEFNKIWNEPIWMSSTYVVTATTMGSNLVRAGFMISASDEKKTKLLKQVGFYEMAIMPGNFLYCKSRRPLSYTGIESFEILNQAVKNGYYKMRTNDILVKAGSIHSREAEIFISIV